MEDSKKTFPPRGKGDRLRWKRGHLPPISGIGCGSAPHPASLRSATFPRGGRLWRRGTACPRKARRGMACPYRKPPQRRREGQAPPLRITFPRVPHPAHRAGFPPQPAGSFPGFTSGRLFCSGRQSMFPPQAAGSFPGFTSGRRCCLGRHSKFPPHSAGSRRSPNLARLRWDKKRAPSGRGSSFRLHCAAGAAYAFSLCAYFAAGASMVT